MRFSVNYQERGIPTIGLIQCCQLTGQSKKYDLLVNSCCLFEVRRVPMCGCTKLLIAVWEGEKLCVIFLPTKISCRAAMFFSMVGVL